MKAYLNEQIKALYNISEQDYLNWCKTNKKPISHKDSVSTFIFKLRTGRLIKNDYGQFKVKKPRKTNRRGY